MLSTDLPYSARISPPPNRYPYEYQLNSQRYRLSCRLARHEGMWQNGGRPPLILNLEPRWCTGEWTPGRFSRNSPNTVLKQKVGWGSHTWSGSFRKLKKSPWPSPERNYVPWLIQPVAWPLYKVQFIVISTGALQNTTPYRVILHYLRWKPQGHTKRIFQGVGHLKDSQTTRKDICSWHRGAAVKCCAPKARTQKFHQPSIRVQPTSTSGSRIRRLYQMKGYDTMKGKTITRSSKT